MTDADAYVRLALFAIEMASYPHSLREWWRDEALRRAKYRLTPTHEQILIDACKARVAEVEREAEPHYIL